MQRLLSWLFVALLLVAPIPSHAQTTLQGNTFLGALASGAKPTATTGAEGSWFLDANTGNIWGPKSSGSWGASASYSLGTSSGLLASNNTWTGTNAFNQPVSINLSGSSPSSVLNLYSPSGDQLFFSTFIGGSGMWGVGHIDPTGIITSLGNYSWFNFSSGTAAMSLTSAGNLYLAGLAGTGSRPVCVTSASLLEPGSLASGLTTCP